MGRLTELMEDLRLSRGGRGAEAFFALLRGGHLAAPLLSDALADPQLRPKIATIITEAPLRSIIAIAAAARAVRAAVDPLLAAIAPSCLLESASQLASLGTPNAERALAHLKPLIQIALDTAPRGSLDWVRGNHASSRLLLAAGEYGAAATLLAGLLAAVTAEDTAANPGVRILLPEIAAGLEAALTASGSFGQAFEAVLSLQQAGLTAEAARLLARGMVSLSQDAGAEHLSYLLVALDPAAPEDRVRLEGLLQAAWEESASAVAARQRAREGYFSRALAGVQSLVKRVEDQLEDPLAAMGAAPGVESLCQDAASRVAGLMEELVAFQPLRPEPSNPRQVALEVALACKDDLAAQGVALSVAPPPGDGRNETVVTIDPALTKGLLRGVLRSIGAMAAQAGAREAGTGSGGISATIAGLADAGATGSLGACFSIRLSGLRGQGRDERPGRRAKPTNAPLSIPLDSAASVGTIPDILLRCSGTISWGVEGTGKRGATTLRLFLPSLEPAPGNGQIDPAQAFDEAVSAVGSGNVTPEEGAARLSALFSGLVLRELELWGKDLALVLHDLKNSLAFVQGWLREDSVYDSETVRSRCLENIEDLQFWLSEAGAMLERDEGAGSYVDLGSLVTRVLRGLAAVLARRQQTLQLEVRGQPPRVPASPFAVASIVRNLAKNAIEAMPEGGALRITAAYDASRSAVGVEIKDQGLGFPEAMLAGAANPEVSDGLHRPHLGLATVRRLLGEQGGELLLRNDQGGVATALFTTGRGAADLATGVDGWENLLDDTQRALRAARALNQAGDPETARHLWTAAIGIEADAALAHVRTHELVPLTLELANGSSTRPQPKPALRGAIMRFLGDDAWPKAEAAARRLFGRILQGRMDVKDLSVAEIGLFVLVYGTGGGSQEQSPLGPGLSGRKEAVRAGTVLFRAAQALEGGRVDDATELLVVNALHALVSIRLARAGD